MSTIAPQSPAGSLVQRPSRTTAPAPIPLSRIVLVEPRKSFDTRAGCWQHPLLTFLAAGQAWFRDWQPWVDPNYSQDALF